MLKPYDNYNNTWNLAYLPYVFALRVRICPRPSAFGKYGHLGQIRRIPGIIVCILIDKWEIKKQIAALIVKVIFD